MKFPLFGALIEKIELKDNSFSLFFDLECKRFEINYYRNTPIAYAIYYDTSLKSLTVSFLQSEFDINLCEIDSKEDLLVKKLEELCYSKQREIVIGYNDHWSYYESLEDWFKEEEYKFVNDSDKDICIKKNKYWEMWNDVFDNSKAEPFVSYSLIPLLEKLF